jgi:hypothetical protein
MAKKSNLIVEMPFVTRVEKGRSVLETAEQLVCPECEGAFELDSEAIDYEQDFEVDCPECDQALEIHPYALITLDPIYFTPTQDVSDFLDQYENKTAVLNAAVRLLKNSMQE